MKHRLLALVILIATLQLIATAQTPKYARVISQSANLRDTPSVTGISALEITEDTLVKVLDEKLPWYVVRVGNRVGWMHGHTLEFISAQRSTAKPLEQNVSPIYTPPTRPTPRRDSSREPAPDSGGYTRPDSGSDRTYIRGPRGGCYYVSASGRKVYVDRSLCN